MSTLHFQYPITPSNWPLSYDGRTIYIDVIRHVNISIIKIIIVDAVHIWIHVGLCGKLHSIRVSRHTFGLHRGWQFLCLYFRGYWSFRYLYYMILRTKKELNVSPKGEKSPRWLGYFTNGTNGFLFIIMHHERITDKFSLSISEVWRTALCLTSSILGYYNSPTIISML